MSFLSKLKQRLFKSSSKIEDGIETIIDNELEPSENLADNYGLSESKVQNESLDKSFDKEKATQGSDSSLDKNRFFSKILRKLFCSSFK